MKLPIENIELIRKARSMSREDVAQKLEVTLSAYGKLERGETSLTLERLYQLAEIFKMQPEEILTLGQSRKGNVTYVPVEAQAGFLAGHTQEYVEYKTYSLPFIEGHNLFMIDANGDSMYPTIHHGDRLIVEQTMDKVSFEYGRIYVLVTKEGCVIKRIYSNIDNRKNVVLKSDNAIYEPYDLDKHEILTVWRVRDYLLRTNLVPRQQVSLAEPITSTTKKTRK